MREVVVDFHACTDCRLCGDVCPHDAITFTGGGAVIDAQRCEGCGDCVIACPARAIHQTDVRD